MTMQLKSPPRQQRQVLEYLVAHSSVTGLEAWRGLGVYRLSAVIKKLRLIGVPIDTERVGPSGYACYRLLDERLAKRLLKGGK